MRQRKTAKTLLMLMAGIVIAQVLLFLFGVMDFPRIFAFVLVMDIVITLVLWAFLALLHRSRESRNGPAS
jgi:hypothetical protein